MSFTDNLAAHMRLLGREVRDTVTLREGVVTLIAFDIGGCVQAFIVKRMPPQWPQERQG